MFSCCHCSSYEDDAEGSSTVTSIVEPIPAKADGGALDAAEDGPRALSRKPTALSRPGSRHATTASNGLGQNPQEIARSLTKAVAEFVSMGSSGPVEDVDDAIFHTESSTNIGTFLNVKKSVSRWAGIFSRNKDTQAEAITDQEQNRGVRIMRTYDFYDPSSTKNRMRIRKMYEDKHFHRRTLPNEEIEKDGEKDGADADSDGEEDLERMDSNKSADNSGKSTPGGSPDGSPSSRRSKNLSNMTPVSEPPQSPTRSASAMVGGTVTMTDGGIVVKRKRVTLTNMERATKWGTLVAKVLHQQVVEFGSVTGQAAVRMRLNKKAEDKSSFVRQSVKERAKMVMRQAAQLSHKIGLESEDVQDGEWHPDGLMELLFGKEFTDTLIILLHAAEKTLALEPTLAEVSVPCRVFGDTHGQLRDLFMYFHAYGSPHEKRGPSFVFNGDFVDRGAHQVEVAGLLLAMKVALPNRVFLIRGNHEDKEMNTRYGFLDACNDTLGLAMGKKMFDLFHKCFDQLPLGSVIGGRVLTVHGGIGDGSWRLNDLRAVKKPLTSSALGKNENNWLYNLMWSDPIKDDDAEKALFFGVHDSPRGKKAASFARDVTKTFCALNGISLIIRSHEVAEGEAGFGILHDEMLIRVFSARDYEGHDNDGATMLISKERSSTRSEGKANRNSKGKDKEKEMLTVKAQVLGSTNKMRTSVRGQLPKSKADIKGRETSREKKDRSSDKGSRTPKSGGKTPRPRRTV